MARNMKRDTIILIILGLSAAAFLGFAFFLTPKEPVKIPANNQITATSTVNIPVRIEEKIKWYYDIIGKYERGDYAAIAEKDNPFVSNEKVIIVAVLPQEKDGPKLRGCSGCSIIIQNNNQKKIVFNIYIPEIVPYINNLPPDVRKLNDVTLINAPDFSYPLDFLDKDNIILHSIGGFPGSYPSTINLNLRTGEFIQKFDK